MPDEEPVLDAAMEAVVPVAAYVAVEFHPAEVTTYNEATATDEVVVPAAAYSCEIQPRSSPRLRPLGRDSPEVKEALELDVAVEST